MGKIKFYKYQGTGNDFVMIDNRNRLFDTQNIDLVASLCHRRFGIGADGCILLENEPGFDFKMVYYNADGRQSSMCGNGGRCLVQFAHDLGVIGSHARFLAVDGPHDAFIENGLVHLKMIDVEQVDEKGDYFFMNTGSPHYVQNVTQLEEFPVYEEGKKIRYSDLFKPSGTNVNFAEQQGDTLYVRTFERGVEDETYSCGTGVTAAAIAASYNGMASPVRIRTKGGELAVSYKKEDSRYTQVYLIGPAKLVFEGEIEV